MKRFRVTFGLLMLGLLLAVPAWAVVTTYKWSAVGADSWSKSLAWTPPGPPGSADTVIFDNTSIQSCLINGGAVTCGVFKMNLGAGSTVTIKAGGSLTCNKFTCAAGTFVDGGRTLTSHSDLVVSTGTFTSTGTEVIDGTGNVSNTTAANIFNSLVVHGVPGIVATRTGNVYCKDIEMYPGDSLKGAYTLYLRPTGNDFLSAGVGGGGAILGGGTDIYVASNLTEEAFIVRDSLVIHGAAATDTLTLSGYANANGIYVGPNVTLKDAGYAVSSAGNLLIDVTATVIKSTGSWSQTGDVSANAVNTKTANAFYAYVATAALDTIFFNPVATNDTFAVSAIFSVTGTRTSTVLCGKTGGTNMLFPTNAYAHDCVILRLHSADRQVLKAYSCLPHGHCSGVAFGS